MLSLIIFAEEAITLPEREETEDFCQILNILAGINNMIFIRNEILQIVGNGFTDCPDGLVNKGLETEQKYN